MLETHKELVQRFFDDVFNHQNLAACDAIAAEDYAEYAVAPFAQSAPGKVNGPQNLRGNAQWLLAQFPDLHMSVEAIVAEGFARDTVARVIRMVDLNEYKRRQAAIGVRITQRGFGRDRRYPITSGWQPGD